VADSVLQAMTRPLIDHRGPEFSRLLQSIEAQLQPIFGTAGSIFILGSSGTGGLESAVASLFSPGDRVLAAPVGVFGQRLVDMARTYGCRVDVMETKPGFAVDAQQLAERLKRDTARSIRGILLTHNETSTGVANDMRLLAEAIGEHPAYTVVDSVSGMGASDFRMHEWRLDAVITASQKVFAAPPGVAMVALSARAAQRAVAEQVPIFYFNLGKAKQFAELGQTPWTPPISTCFALDAALEAYHAQGAQIVWHRLASYASAIRAAAAALGLENFSQPGAHSNTVVAIKAPAGLDVAELLRGLREERGIVLSGGQKELKGAIFRIGTMGSISQTDVMAMLGALEIALWQQKLQVRSGAGVQAALQVFLEDDVAKLGDGSATDEQTDVQTMATPR